LSWNADYVLTVSRDDKNADLDGWVTVVNNSGTAFHNARLQLVAGELNRVADRGTMGRSDMNVAVPMQRLLSNFSRNLSANTISIPSAARFGSSSFGH